jgi:hypothetical protein
VSQVIGVRGGAAAHGLVVLVRAGRDLVRQIPTVDDLARLRRTERLDFEDRGVGQGSVRVAAGAGGQQEQAAPVVFMPHLMQHPGGDPRPLSLRHFVQTIEEQQDTACAQAALEPSGRLSLHQISESRARLPIGPDGAGQRGRAAFFSASLGWQFAQLDEDGQEAPLAVAALAVVREDEQQVLEEGGLAAAGRADERQTASRPHGAQEVPNRVPSLHRTAEQVHFRGHEPGRANLELDIDLAEIEPVGVDETQAAVVDEAVVLAEALPVAAVETELAEEGDESVPRARARSQALPERVRQRGPE